MAKILIVEDNNELAKGLSSYLEMHGYLTELSSTGEDALQLLRGFQYDLIILDWGLPAMSGAEVCRAFRKEGGQTPIIFLTGKGDIQHLEEGFDSGADDYISKPFDIRVLSARVKAVLKRRTGTFVPVLTIGDLLLDTEKNLLTKGSNKVQLRAKEASLLEYLMRRPDQVFSAQQLLDAVWASDAESSTDSVRSWINLLRHKLASVGEDKLIKTIVGSGYTIEKK